MGMAASQARFLQLTARKTNLEYMGQQLNQERLALANESAGLFERQLTIAPPVPPSSLDDKYYTPAYTFYDTTNEIQKKIMLGNAGAGGAVVTYNQYLPDGSFQVSTEVFDGDASDGNTLAAGEAAAANLTIDNIQYTSNVDASGISLADAEFDAISGRLTSIEYGGVEYNGEALTYSPEFKEDAFNDDMNKYQYQKATYDYEIERINLETARIQKQDKSLELKMKQIDTEYKAITTEMDAVQKVIQKGIDSTFKTFS